MAKTNQQIIVTEGDSGVEILTQFIDTSKKPVPIEGCSCKIKFAYDGNVITEKSGVVIDEPKGIVSVILDKEETQYSGLWTSYWICYDQFNGVTATENIYYYVQPYIGSINNPAFTELLNYFNRDEVNNMFKNILEQLNNYTISKDDVEEYIKTYIRDKIDDDFVRQCILDAIGNGSDYAKKKELEEISLQLDTNKNEIINLDNTVEKIKNNNIKFKENFLLKRNPYGTYENASSFSVVTNGDNKVQVLGISPEKDHVLAEYNNRDMVGIFNSITTNNSNIMIYDNCSYTVNSVKLPLDANMENLKKGMIIDTLHDTKYSAIIKSIDFNDKIIYVYNWYKMGNTSKGQIPPSGKGCKINNITKIWNLNTNLVLRAEDFNTAACGYEMDIINHQAHTHNIDGIDMVLAGTYGAHRGYVARGKDNLKWTYGFYADNCDTGYYVDNDSIGFRALNSKLFGFLSNNSEIGFCSKGDKSKPALHCEQNSKVFTITNEGKMSSLGLKYVHAQPNQTTNIDVYNTPVVLMSGNIRLNNPSECACKMLFVHNIANEQHSITANMKKGNSSMTGLQVPAGKTVVLYCDGSIFYVLDFNLT